MNIFESELGGNKYFPIETSQRFERILRRVHESDNQSIFVIVGKLRGIMRTYKDSEADYPLVAATANLVMESMQRLAGNPPADLRNSEIHSAIKYAAAGAMEVMGLIGSAAGTEARLAIAEFDRMMQDFSNPHNGIDVFDRVRQIKRRLCSDNTGFTVISSMKHEVNNQGLVFNNGIFSPEFKANPYSKMGALSAIDRYKTIYDIGARAKLGPPPQTW